MKIHQAELTGRTKVVTLQLLGGAALPATANSQPGDHFFLFKEGSTQDGDIYVFKGGKWVALADMTEIISKSDLGATMAYIE